MKGGLLPLLAWLAYGQAFVVPVSFPGQQAAHCRGCGSRAGSAAFAASAPPPPTGIAGRQGMSGQVGTSRSTPQSRPRPPLGPDFYSENLLDKISLALFRRLVANEIGFSSDKEGYAGLIEEAQEYMVVQKASPEDQEQMVTRVLSTIAGPLAPPVYRLFMSPWPWAPYLTALFTPPFFKFLVGPNRAENRASDGLPGGVYVERCRFLEETNCKGMCTSMCKLPTEAFFRDTMGLDMSMTPDFDTYECRLSFGEKPLPFAEDEKVPVGCLADCSSRQKGAEIARVCPKQ